MCVFCVRSINPFPVSPDRRLPSYSPIHSTRRNTLTRTETTPAHPIALHAYKHQGLPIPTTHLHAQSNAHLHHNHQLAHSHDTYLQNATASSAPPDSCLLSLHSAPSATATGTTPTDNNQPGHNTRAIPNPHDTNMRFHSRTQSSAYRRESTLACMPPARLQQSPSLTSPLHHPASLPKGGAATLDDPLTHSLLAWQPI